MIGSGPGMTRTTDFDCTVAPITFTLTGGDTDLATALAGRSGAPARVLAYRLVSTAAVTLTVTDGNANADESLHQPGEGYSIAAGIVSIVGASGTIKVFY
jgi:hypothetical protein